VNRFQGIFSLTDQTITITESVGTYNIRIVRCGGCRGRVAVPYRTEEGTAKEPRDYQHSEGELIFEDGEIEYVPIAYRKTEL
jgi:solute carrier family 8 (sodium/calcium exchanger)